MSVWIFSKNYGPAPLSDMSTHAGGVVEGHFLRYVIGLIVLVVCHSAGVAEHPTKHVEILIGAVIRRCRLIQI